MSDFHSITPYGSKVCHGSVTGVTCDTTVVGCDSTRYSGSLVLLAIVRCQSSILANPTGFASLKWVLISFANSVQLLCHAGVRLGSSSQAGQLTYSYLNR